MTDHWYIYEFIITFSLFKNSELLLLGIIRANTAHPSQQAQGLSFYFQDSDDPRYVVIIDLF